MKWLKQTGSENREQEIEHLVPEMLQYVADHYVPSARHSISSSCPEYSFPPLTDDENPTITEMNLVAQTAGKDKSMDDSFAVENTYYAREKDTAENKSFSSEVVRLVKERYKKDSDFCHAAGIDKQTFRKICSDAGCKPSRITAFHCCAGLKLDVAEAEELLRLAGIAFSPNDPNDLVFKFCLEKGIRDISEINYMLYRYATRPQEEVREHPIVNERKICAMCGEDIEDVDYHDLPDGRIVCDYCYDNITAECSECGTRYLKVCLERWKYDYILCPDCFKRYFPDFDQEENRKQTEAAYEAMKRRFVGRKVQEWNKLKIRTEMDEDSFSYSIDIDMDENNVITDISRLTIKRCQSFGTARENWLPYPVSNSDYEKGGTADCLIENYVNFAEE